ncbi:Gibberellin 2-beta-dioxygenase [Thalictrum thalictroides]|uniref:gibberellin 2beta-dioxygenase n=1 Tax=Thalictrum thalictroides TaxID=46969 RepID=A0A7J6WUZ9_THATH|nr:Gibberellin 2-beta-dioxygenase [Thalictrum thalictroides]
MEACFSKSFDQFPIIKSAKPSRIDTNIPSIDLFLPEAKTLLVKACEEFGFFKVINHGVPMEFARKLECEAKKFFSATLYEKEKVGPPNPSGYGNMNVGRNGDICWVEYLLMVTCKPDQFIFERIPETFGASCDHFCSAMRDYVSAVRKLTCEVLELLAEGLELKPKDYFSNLIVGEDKEHIFRINHNPPCPQVQNLDGLGLVGFGEHTDPQIISTLRSNDVEGYQIRLQNGTWLSVPPDETSLFFNVGDCLQVMTNGRFKSVKHRVLANSMKSRISMIYFGGPRQSEIISPLQSIMKDGEESLYEQFTWAEYRKFTSKSRLSDTRLKPFEKK